MSLLDQVHNIELKRGDSQPEVVVEGRSTMAFGGFRGNQRAPPRGINVDTLSGGKPSSDSMRSQAAASIAAISKKNGLSAEPNSRISQVNFARNKTVKRHRQVIEAASRTSLVFSGQNTLSSKGSDQEKDFVLDHFMKLREESKVE